MAKNSFVAEATFKSHKIEKLLSVLGVLVSSLEIFLTSENVVLMSF